MARSRAAASRIMRWVPDRHERKGARLSGTRPRCTHAPSAIATVGSLGLQLSASLTGTQSEQIGRRQMTIHRRHVILSGALALAPGALTSGASSAAETADAAALAEAVESLRKAMLDADKAKLEALVSDHLSYGHSS